MAITNKEKGVWGLDQVYNKINQGSIWSYTGSNQLWSWGYGGNGQLGDNNRVSQSSPIQISGETWQYVANSNSSPDTFHMLATKTDGTLWSWGPNNNGGLGQNNQSPTGISSPAQIGSDTTWGQQMVRGYQASWAIKTDGTLWSWGYNLSYGALGHNNKTRYSSPTQVGSESTWNKIGTRHFGIIASKTDGTLWGWGRNSSGEIGLNNKTSYSSPKQIPGTTWTGMVSGGYYNSCAIKTDGTLWTWGYNGQGELGHNNKTEYSSPKQVPGTWSKVASGREQTLAIKTDGTLWAWGDNTYGYLGDNTGIKRSSPVQVPGTNWSNVISGNYHALAVKTDGTLWSWGCNNGGQLGQGAVNNNGLSSPVQIPGTDWNSEDRTFAAGVNISFATKSL